VATSTVSFAVSKANECGGVVESVGPNQYVNSAAPDGMSIQAFTAATFAAVPVPVSPAPTGVFIIPPAGNTGAITLKGVTGDTGVALNMTQPTWLSLGTGAAFGLLCANTISVGFEWT
jgi:hypothetical protein